MLTHFSASSTTPGGFRIWSRLDWMTSYRKHRIFLKRKVPPCLGTLDRLFRIWLVFFSGAFFLFAVRFPVIIVSESVWARVARVCFVCDFKKLFPSSLLDELSLSQYYATPDWQRLSSLLDWQRLPTSFLDLKRLSSAYETQARQPSCPVILDWLCQSSLSLVRL